MSCDSETGAQVLRWVEILGRRPVEHRAEAIEARAVTRTVPRHGRGVPSDDAAQVRADGRAAMHRAALVTVDGDLPARLDDDRAVVRRDLIDRLHVAGGEPVLVLQR